MKSFHQVLSLEKKHGIAIIDNNRSYSYKELNEESFNICKVINNLDIVKGNKLVIISDSNFYSIALIIACSIQNITFTVISPREPEKRKNNIINSLNPNLILRDDISSKKNSGIGNFQIDKININKKNQVNKETPAYIVFTSGTTGNPKGIVMKHNAVINFFVGLLTEYRLDINSRYISLSPLQFDFALLDIGLALGSGATLIIPKKNLFIKPNLLMNNIIEHDPTHISGVPTMWKMFLNIKGLNLKLLKSLKLILFAGEYFPIDNMKIIFKTLPNISFFNIYGQSESIACSFCLINKDNLNDKNSVSVGKAHNNMYMFLMDNKNQVIKKPNVEGELYIGGNTLFSGYWRQEELNNNKIIQNPTHKNYEDKVFKTGDICYFDDEINYYFIGRIDNQIKINGNRIEVEEIESTFMTYPDINNCCLIIDKNKSLHIIIQAKKDTCICESSLKEYIKNRLPIYMLPRQYHITNKIIISVNGKNDRNKNAFSIGVDI